MLNRIKRWWRWNGRYMLTNIKYGVKNLIRWFPIIWKDRDWDQAYIWDVLESKLRNQSHYTKHYGYYVDNNHDARNMLICANLIKKIREEEYTMEYLDYYSWDNEFHPTNNDKTYKVYSHINWEKFDDYFKKYPLVYKKIITNIESENIDDKKHIAMVIADTNHKRAINLLFKIMENHIERWWY